MRPQQRTTGIASISLTSAVITSSFEGRQVVSGLIQVTWLLFQDWTELAILIEAVRQVAATWFC
jgi:hypothetical protein